jgi:hypothetical protein
MIWLLGLYGKPVVMDSRPRLLPLHTYALNLTYGLVDVALFHR